MAKRPDNLSLRGGGATPDQKPPDIKRAGYTPMSRKGAVGGTRGDFGERGLRVWQNVWQFQDLSDPNTPGTMKGAMNIQIKDPLTHATELRVTATSGYDLELGMPIKSGSGTSLVLHGEAHQPFFYDGQTFIIEDSSASGVNGRYTVSGTPTYNSVDDETTVSVTSALPAAATDGRVAWAIMNPAFGGLDSGTVGNSTSANRVIIRELLEEHLTVIAWEVHYEILNEEGEITGEHTYDYNVIPSVSDAKAKITEDGRVLLDVQCDEDSASIATIAQNSAFLSAPTESDWTAATGQNLGTNENNRQLTNLEVYTGVLLGETIYIAIRAYSDLSKTGLVSKRAYYLSVSTSSIGLPRATAHTYQKRIMSGGALTEFGVLRLIVDDPTGSLAAVEMRESMRSEPFVSDWDTKALVTSKTYEIYSADSVAEQFVIDKDDVTPFLKDGDEFTVVGTNAGTYTCNGDSVHIGGQTTITVNEDVTTNQASPDGSTIEPTDGDHYEELVELKAGAPSYIEWRIISDKWNLPILGKEVFDANTRPKIQNVEQSIIYNATFDRYELEIDYWGDEDVGSVALIVDTSPLTVDPYASAWDTPDEVSNDQDGTLLHVPSTPFAVGDQVYWVLNAYSDDNQTGMRLEQGRSALGSSIEIGTSTDFPTVEPFYFQTTDGDEATPGQGTVRLYFDDPNDAITEVRYRTGKPIVQGDTWTTFASAPVTPSDVAGFEGYYDITGIALDKKVNTQLQWVIEFDSASAGGLERASGSYSWDSDRNPEFLRPVTARVDNEQIYLRWEGDDDVKSITYHMEQVDTASGLTAGFDDEPDTWVAANSLDGASGEVSLGSRSEPWKYVYIRVKALPNLVSSYTDGETLVDVYGEEQEVIIEPSVPKNLVVARYSQSGGDGTASLTVLGAGANPSMVDSARYRITKGGPPGDLLGPADASWSDFASPTVVGADAQYSVTTELWDSGSLSFYKDGVTIEWSFDLFAGETDGTNAVTTNAQGYNKFDFNRKPNFIEGPKIIPRGAITAGQGVDVQLAWKGDEDVTGVAYVWDEYDLNVSTNPDWAAGEDLGPAGASTNGHTKGYLNSADTAVNLSNVPANKIIRARVKAFDVSIIDTYDHDAAFRQSEEIIVEFANVEALPPIVDVIQTQPWRSDTGTLKLNIKDPQNRMPADPSAVLFRSKSKFGSWSSYSGITANGTPDTSWDRTYEDSFTISVDAPTFVQYKVKWNNDTGEEELIEGTVTFDANRDAKFTQSELNLVPSTGGGPTTNSFPEWQWNVDEDTKFIRYAVSVGSPPGLSSGNTAGTDRYPASGDLSTTPYLTFDGIANPPLKNKYVAPGDTVYLWAQAWGQSDVDVDQPGAITEVKVTRPKHELTHDVGFDVLKSGGDPDFTDPSFNKTVVIGGGSIYKNSGGDYNTVSITGETRVLGAANTNYWIYHDYSTDAIADATSVGSIFSDDVDNTILAYVRTGSASDDPPEIIPYNMPSRLTEQNLTIATLDALFGRIDTLNIARVLNIESGGEFRATGSGTVGVDFTGFRIMNSALTGYANEVEQVKLDATTGVLTAGAGAVSIDVNGLDIDMASVFAAPNSVTWNDYHNSSPTRGMSIGASSLVGGDLSAQMVLRSDVTGESATLSILAQGETSSSGRIDITANAGAGGSEISVMDDRILINPGGSDPYAALINCSLEFDNITAPSVTTLKLYSVSGDIHWGGLKFNAGDWSAATGTGGYGGDTDTLTVTIDGADYRILAESV